MPTLKNTKKKEDSKNYSCDFCGREFTRETTIAKHLCEYKQRFLNKELISNRIGFQSWLQFYSKNSLGKKQKTYEDFIRSSYYTAFVKFGQYCIDASVLNISRFVDWLLSNQIRIDIWNTDSMYTKFLIEYLRIEDHLDALARSMETCIKLAEIEQVQSKDVLRYGNKNRICHAITTGKISPWVLYQSESGTKFLDNLDETQVKMVIDYINPEQWALKFKRNSNQVLEVKELLSIAGY